MSEHIGKVVVFENLPSQLTQINSFGVPNSEWREPLELWGVATPSELYRHHLYQQFSEYPWFIYGGNSTILIGYVWNGVKYEKLAGYQPPHFAPGLSWKAEVIPAHARLRMGTDLIVENRKRLKLTPDQFYCISDSLHA